MYLLLETSFEALVDSGLSLEDIAHTECGVYVGACFSDMHSFELSDPAGMTGYEHTGCAKAMFANRLSYSYNLHGPSMTIDTACSSSLVALVQVCFKAMLRAPTPTYCTHTTIHSVHILLRPTATYRAAV